MPIRTIIICIWVAYLGGKIAFIFAVLLGVTLLLKLNGGSFKAVFLLYFGAETAKRQPVATPSRSFDEAVCYQCVSHGRKAQFIYP